MSARWAAVAGWPVAHSLSPALHAAWLEASGASGEYRRMPAPPENAEATIRAALDDPLCAGLNVTLPHKTLALDLADSATDAARAIGAANLLRRGPSGWIADNTDAAGFLHGLARQAPNLRLDGAAALVIGAGGAARAAAFALARSGARVAVSNRTAARAETVARSVGAETRPWPPDPAGYDLLVNATALGLEGDGSPPVDLAAAKPGAIVYDLVYRPLETPFLRAARVAGLGAVDGLDMLVGQARPAFEAFFGRPPPEIDARAVLLASLEAA